MSNDCSNSYLAQFEPRNGFNRAIILKGSGLLNNPNLGCDCISNNKDCQILNNLPNDIEKIFDTNCGDTLVQQSFTLGPNDIYKYLVIPDCNNSNPNTTWDFSVSPICCNTQYSVNFWSYTAPSRLIILAGSGLITNANLFCDCVSNDKNCAILNSLPSDIYKVLDTNCLLTNQSNFNQVIQLPSNVPNFVLVIPDCLNQNSDATWNLNITPYCSSVCKPCDFISSTSCSFNYLFNLSSNNNSKTLINTFEKVTSYKDNQLNNVNIKVSSGSRGYEKDIGLTVESVNINSSLANGVRGITSLNIGNINFESPRDTYIRIEQNGFPLKEHESWTEDALLFNKYNYDNLSQTEAGAIIPTNLNTLLTTPSSDYIVQYKGYTSNQNLNKPYKQKFVIKEFPENNVGLPMNYSFNSGWASYDVTSGMNFKNVFSYGVQVVDKLTFANGFIIENENRITGKQDIINWIKSGLTPVLFTGSNSAFNFLSAYCLEGPECPEPPEQCQSVRNGGGGFGGGPACPIECWTGNNITSPEYYFWLTGTLNKYQDSEEFLKSNNIYGKLVTGAISSPFVSLTGRLRYNTWVSGDKFKFVMYPFDYTGLYKALHLGNNPIYPPYNIELTYPNDWTNMYNFVDKLNEKLRDVSAPIWYPYLCLSGTPSGYYVSGSLMEFSVNTGSCCLPSGDLDIFDFQNLIDFRSLKSLPGLPITGKPIKDEDLCLAEIKSDGSGRLPWFFDLKIELTKNTRRNYTIYSGYSYLIPTCIEFQVWENNDWKTIDKHCELYNNITGLEPTCIIKEISGLVDNNNGYINQNYINLVTGGSFEEDDFSLDTIGSPFSGNYRTLLNFQQRITVKNRGKCNGWTDIKDVEFIWPENFPTGIITKDGKLSGVNTAYWCNPEETEGKDDCICEPLGPMPDCSRQGFDCIPKEEKDEECGCPYWTCVCPTEDILPVEICQLRTGWNLTGIYGLEAKNKSYDKYRIVFSNFSGQNIESYKPINEFYIGNINLFSITGGIPLPVLTGSEKCPIGSDYIIDVFGTVPLQITGVHNYSINQSMSGKYTNYFEVTKEILDEERNVKFNKVSGLITSQIATGFWNKTLTPSGWACETFDDYFFYDPNSREITFEKTICAYASGFTEVSGDFTALKQSVVNRELLVGGRFNAPIAFITYTGSGIYTGYIDNVTYKEYDVVGYYPISGLITGFTTNGILNINNKITGSAPITEDSYLYYPIPTGFINATGYVQIDYSKINNFDYFTVFGNNFVYHSNTSEYPFPSFFNNIDTLSQLLSGVGLDLGISSTFQNNEIFITSLRQGSLGNIPITSTNTGAFITLGMSGGRDIFPKVYNYYYTINDGFISGTEITPKISANINDVFLGTGFYFSNSGKGTVTGTINTFTGVRYFTGLWDIATGNNRNSFRSFLRNRWISGNSFITNNFFNSVSLNYINIRTFYLNQFDTFKFEENDIVDLIIKDKNNPEISESGIIFRLEGQK